MPRGLREERTFGQSGDLVDLYREYKIDAAAITEACADVLSPSAEVKAVKPPRAVSKAASSKKKETKKKGEGIFI